VPNRSCGLPAIADVAALLRLLAHLGDLRIAGHGGEEAVDIDAANAASEGEVLLRRQPLVAEEDHAALTKDTADLG